MARTTPISRLRLFWKFTGWIAFIAFLPALIVTFISMAESRKSDRLETAGAEAAATIINKDVRVTTDSDGDRQTSYYLIYEWQHERRTYTDEDSVGRAFYNSLQIGDWTTLRYWLEDPMVNEIKPGSSGTNALITKIIAVVLWVLGGYWAERCWRKASRAVKVRDRGERRAAEVTEHYRTSVRVNNRPMYRLKWRDGAGREGQSMWHRSSTLDDYPVGSEVTIYADPRGKWPSMWEADVGPSKG